MKPNRRAIKAACRGDRLRLSFYITNAARRYAHKRHRTFALCHKASLKITQSYKNWLYERGFYPAAPFHDWPERVAAHLRKYNPARQEMERRREYNEKEQKARHEMEVKDAALSMLRKVLF